MHTPSAYTLTNTTRPSRIKRKIRGSARVSDARGRGRIGILAKQQVQCTTVTETNANKKYPQERRTSRVTTRWCVPMTQSEKLPWFTSVQPRALKHFSIQEHACSHTRYTINNNTMYNTADTLKAHLSTLNYTCYGYVKPIDFVNCPKKDF